MPVEVAAWFAGSQLAATVVGPDRYFRIGTAPDVDLAVPGFASFPLVEAGGGRRIRIPVGARARWIAPGRAPESLPEGSADVRDLGPGARIELAFGEIQITICAATSRVAIARPPAIEVRPLGYVAGALVAHLALWSAAMVLADPPPPPLPPSIPLHAHLIPKTPLAPPLPPPEKRRARRPVPRSTSPAAAATAAGGEPAPTPGVRVDPHGHLDPHAGGGLVESASLGTAISAIMGHVDLAKALADVGPLYREEDANAKLFGGSGGHFDPTTCCGTIATGRYATISSGRGAGDDYDLPDRGGPPPGVEVSVCVGKGCAASGSIDRDAVTSWVAPHVDEIRGCFERAAGAKDGAVVLAFTIDGRGSVHGVHARGLGAVGPCVGSVVGSISFPRTDASTSVTYQIGFRRG